MDTTIQVAASRRWPNFRTLWRWHFYAGLLCIPMVLWLALTGSMYLFKPQIDGWLERRYNSLQADGRAVPASVQVNAALRVIPGSLLDAYELPASPQHAARVLLVKGDRLYRVYVDPRDGQVMGQVRDDRRFTRMLFYLHGELMSGTPGSMVVETAASWTVVMLLTGLALWWPRGQKGLGGVLYPRMNRGGRLFWRDLHAVAGLWVSALALFLILSGLPWSKSWGGMLKGARELAARHSVQQDWTTGSAAEKGERRMRYASASASSAGAQGGGEHSHGGTSPPRRATWDATALDAVVPAMAALDLPTPVLVTPPRKIDGDWKGRSDTQNRPRRVTVMLDGAGNVLKVVPFSQKPLIDRLVGYGVAIHEGQLFGAANQALGVFTATGLVLVCISALMLWTRRKPAGVLGAPPIAPRAPLAVGIFVVIGILAVLLPLFGATLLLVWLLEHVVLSRHARILVFLGLEPKGRN